MSTNATQSAPDSQTADLPVTTFERRFGHPPGLVVLFFAGMWERFSYYGMRGLLKLYMVNHLFVTLRQTLQGGSYTGTGDPGAVFGWRFIQQLLPTIEPETLQNCITQRIPLLLEGNASIHLAPLAADAARSVAEQTCAAIPRASLVYGLYTGFIHLTPFLGGVLANRYLGQRKTVIVGGVLMAIGYLIMIYENTFFIALVLLILGSGAFKPNVYTQVGDLYFKGNPRRDGAFTLFYMGITLGALIGNVICGTLAALYGWHHGFAAAGVGMCLGLTVYLLGQRHLAPDTLGPRGLPAFVGGRDTTVKAPSSSTVDKPAALTRKEWTRVWVLVVLCIFNVVFWAVYEQQGNIMQSWADEQTVWPRIFGSEIPSTWFLSFNPICIIFLAPLLDLFWRRQAKKGTPPTSISKMAISCFLLSISFLVMILGARLSSTGRGSPFWPLFCTLLLTIAELYFIPIGLSLLTKVSPVRIVSIMMGLWLVSSFVGNMLSGYIGIFYALWSNEVFFLLLTVLGIGAGVALLACNKPLKRVIGNDV